MEYISIDIETTGLDRENDQVLEIGAIIENTNNLLPFDEIPKFHAIVEHERYQGSAYAINMNQRIFKILAEQPNDEEEMVEYQIKHNIVDVNNVVNDFYNWCMDNLTNKPQNYNNPIQSVVAGKNYTDFDKPFLHRLPDWDEYFAFHRRALDLGTLFTDFIIDQTPPSLEVCLKRANIEDTVVTHDAIPDAWQVIEVLRTRYNIWYDE